MFILLCVISLILVLIISVLLDYATEINDSDDNKDVINEYFRSDLLDKIDEIIKRMGEYKPERIILGEHFWKRIPLSLRMEWVHRKHKKGLVPNMKKSIIYKDVKIIFDSENKYKFDLE